MTEFNVNIKDNEYKVTIGRGLIRMADKYFNLKRRVFILTDSGTPPEYANAIKDSSEIATVFTVEMGEGSKSLDTLNLLLEKMLEFGLTRTDCAVAVGGGVVGDLLGFASSIYMRGIDFYNVPTTTLSQIDSSIGGKTAINFGGTKNIIGAFHQPKGVLIDLDTLKTLSKRHFSAGLCEALKMSLTSDAELFRYIEKNGISDDTLEYIIRASLEIKRRVVELDEKEVGLRKILNLGHTLGHGIEAFEGGKLYHGECVALGILPVISNDVKKRLIPIFKSLNLPTEYEGNINTALSYICHDKKCEGDKINIILVKKIGSYEIKKMTLNEFCELVKESV